MWVDCGSMRIRRWGKMRIILKVQVRLESDF
jgi:hypothetical protein